MNQYAFTSSKGTEAKAKAAADRPDSELAITSLLAKHDPNPGSLDPRAYQIELFERAKVQNTIAVLDTGEQRAMQIFEDAPFERLKHILIGSGKTLIAVLLLKDILQRELINRANGKAPRIAFFLVRT